MKPHQLKALQFVASHKGTWSRAYLGYAYRFDAPEYKRMPFRKDTFYTLIDMGLVRRAPGGVVVVTPKGRSALIAVQSEHNASEQCEQQLTGSKR